MAREWGARAPTWQALVLAMLAESLLLWAAGAALGGRTPAVPDIIPVRLAVVTDPLTRSAATAAPVPTPLPAHPSEPNPPFRAAPAPHHRAVKAVPRDHAPLATKVPPVSAQPEPVSRPAPTAPPAPPSLPAPSIQPERPPAETPPTIPAYLRNPLPPYPAEARWEGAEGTVVLKVLVRPDGTVGRVELDRRSGHGALDRAALETVDHWRFQPATRDGHPVAAWVCIPIRFRLRDAEGE